MQLRLMLMTMFFAVCQSVPESTMAQSPKEITNSIGMKLVLIPKGSFTMGSPPSEEGRDEEKEYQHEVTLSKDFYLGVTEVTQAQYRRVMGKNPSRFQGKKFRGDGGNHPVEQVSWHDAVEFCKRLSGLPEEKKAGRTYRLPTEAEWEYGCRAGSKTAFSFGENSESLGDYAWFSENSKRQTHPVGEKKPNAWGLYDMHGNVWELCNDGYGIYPKGNVTDPDGSNDTTFRVYRGGSWYYEPEFCRSAIRYSVVPSFDTDTRGFRVALSSPSGTPE